MCRCRPSKLSSPAAANVLALTARSSARAIPTDAPTSHPRTPRATLAAERCAVRARVRATAEPIAVETDQMRVAHQVAPGVDHLNLVAPPAQLVRDPDDPVVARARPASGAARPHPSGRTRSVGGRRPDTWTG